MSEIEKLLIVRYVRTKCINVRVIQTCSLNGAGGLKQNIRTALGLNVELFKEVRSKVGTGKKYRLRLFAAICTIHINTVLYLS